MTTTGCKFVDSKYYSLLTLTMVEVLSCKKLMQESRVHGIATIF